VILKSSGVSFFFSGFCLHPGHKKNVEGKTYPAMDSPLYKEANGTNFVLVEN